MAKHREKRDPYVWEALISILALIVAISLAIVKYESDAQVPILLGVLVAALMGLKAGFSWKEIEGGMLDGITNSLQAIIILAIIGILIGVWILSGVVPTLLYYGLKILHPKIFLPAAVIICAITSLATGTSWGTTGTIGIALIGIGAGLGFPLPPAMVGTDLYTHIKHMTYTTGVSFGITLIIEFILGFFYGGGQADVAGVNQILTGIDSQFTVNPVMLLPALVILGLAYKKIPAIPGIAMGIITAALLGMILQGNSFGEVLSVSWAGYTSNSGVEAVDNLLSKGGFESMLYTISIVLCAMMFGGIMERTNQLRVVVNMVLKKAKSTGSLFTATILTAIGANLILCDQYMSIVMTGKMYSQAFKDHGLHPKNLSRAVEDSATVTANLVPWNTGGAYNSATLGVPTIAYLPWNFFCWISPIVSLLFGWFGITIDRIDEDAEAESGVQDQAEADAA